MPWRQIVVPDSVTAVAKTAATRTALGSGAYDGQAGIVRPSALTDDDEIVTYWNSVDTKWRSRPFHVFGQTDQTYMGVNTTAYSYVGTDTAGSATAQIGTFTGFFPNAYYYLNAGFTIEHRWQTIIRGPASGKAARAILFFFAHNDGEQVTFSSDGSAAAGMSTVLSAATNSIVFRRSQWTPVYKNGSVGVALQASDLTVDHVNLWPRLYMQIDSDPNYGAIIDTSCDLRIVG